MSIDLIKQKIGVLLDDSLGKNLLETDGIKHIGIDEEKNIVILVVAIGKKDPEIEKKLRR